MPFREIESSSRRLIWYVAGTLNMAGGGERIIMEGLRYFEGQGLEATLLLDYAIPNRAALFDGTYAPKLSIVDNREVRGSEYSVTFWRKVLRQLRRVPRLISALALFNPHVIIANDPETCRELWFSSLLSFRKLPTFVTFVHGSPFQFAEDLTKYSLIFRRHFADIRNSDPVYREMIPVEPPPIPLVNRVNLEIGCFLKYLALRRSRCVFVVSEKNRREIELLYGHHNVVAVPPGGFSIVDFTYQRGQDMKTAFGLENQRVILSICRLVPKKRVDLAIRAFAELIQNKRNADCVMVIAGTGPHESTLKMLSEELQIEDKIRFIGYVPEPQLRDWYCSCDVFVSTDNADYDLSLMMALPLGCKVVVSSQYDAPGFLDKMRRFIFMAEPSAKGFAQTIEKALFATLARVNAEDFKELDNLTWEQYFETILSLAQSFPMNKPGMN